MVDSLAVLRGADFPHQALGRMGSAAQSGSGEGLSLASALDGLDAACGFAEPLRRRLVLSEIRFVGRRSKHPTAARFSASSPLLPALNETEQPRHNPEQKSKTSGVERDDMVRSEVTVQATMRKKFLNKSMRRS